MNDNKRKTVGRSAFGIVTGYIRTGDNLIERVISSLKNAEADPESGFKLKNGDVVCTTEAVVAMAQTNYATFDDIATDVGNKFAGAKSLVIVNPIQSRNRFLKLLKAFSTVPTLEKIYVVLTYPSDEVGNELVSRLKLIEAGVNENSDVFTAKEFTECFGKPCHPFTGVDYTELYTNACNGKGEVILCNDFAKLYEYFDCTDYLICSIHSRKETEAIIRRGEKKCGKPFRILSMADILNEPVNGSGYNPEFGLLGTNSMSGDVVKLMPRDCQKYVDELKARILEEFGVHVECMVYGDGAFKDPAGKIWELADPVTTLSKTEGIYGKPNELKLKLSLSDPECENMNEEQLEAFVAAKKKELLATDGKKNELSAGTTPRNLHDILASVADLTSGSGDEGTPVVVLSGYLRNYDEQNNIPKRTDS